MDKGLGKISAAELDFLASIVSTAEGDNIPSRASPSPRASSALSIARLSAPRLSAAQPPRFSAPRLSFPRLSAFNGFKREPRLTAPPGIARPAARGLSMQSGLVSSSGSPDDSSANSSVGAGPADLWQDGVSRAGTTAIDDLPALDGNILLGLYCSQALLGMVNAFLLQNLVKPVCLYVFDGLRNNHVTYAQCNIAPIIYQMPWNFKLFFALVLDNQPLFGSRRYAWVVLGWGGAMCCLLGLALRVGDLVASHDFATYNVLLACTCFFFMFAEVSADGLTIELSQYESVEERGRLLTNGQLVRFSAGGVSLLACTFLLNGPEMYPLSQPEPSLLSWGLNIEQLHWMVFALALPLYLMVVCCLRDPPDRGYSYDWRDVFAAFWESLQSKAMLCMILFNVGFVTIAGLGNPAAVAIASIVLPTPLQLSLSALLAKVLALVGAWTFRRHFIAKNWRVTCGWTHLLLLLEGLFYLSIIYDINGIGQTGYFYCFGDCPISVILGMSQVLSLLVAVEISKCGLEATTYELLTTIHHVALALNSNIGNTLISVMDINTFDRHSYEAARTHGNQDELNKLNAILRNATVLTMGIQMSGILLFVWLLPQNGIMCRVWRDDASYHTKRTGAMGLGVAAMLFIFTVALSVFTLIPETRCLQIAGGLGCNF